MKKTILFTAILSIFILSALKTSKPIFNARFGIIVHRFALPHLSPIPLIVP